MVEVAKNENESFMLDYYKDFDSAKSPILMLESLDSEQDKIAIEDEKKMGYLREKYKNSSR